MNWGNKLLLVFAVFGGMISYMVYRCVQTPVDLVSTQYYNDELAYQQVIDGTNRANGLSGMVRIVPTQQGLRMELPQEMRSRPVKGTILLYCPSDKRCDRHIPFATETGTKEIDKAAIKAGAYTVKVSWESGGLSYFNEQSLVIK